MPMSATAAMYMSAAVAEGAASGAASPRKRPLARNASPFFISALHVTKVFKGYHRPIPPLGGPKPF